MVKVMREIGLSPERVKRIQEAQKRHATFEPNCAERPPEEIIRWHPVNFATMEERAEAMRKAGAVTCTPVL